MVLVSLAMHHNLYLNQHDVKLAFLNSTLDHGVWVRFHACNDHPSRRAFDFLRKSLCGLKQAASDHYVLEHVRLMAFDPGVLMLIANP